MTNLFTDNIAILLVASCGIGNTLIGFISLLSINENTKIENNDNYLLGDYKNILDKIHIVDKEKKYEHFYSWRFLILNEEAKMQQNLEHEFTHDFRHIHYINSKMNLFSTNVAIDLCYDRSLICDRIYERIMIGIDRIKWNETILTELNSIRDQINNNTLGISVRTWEGKHETGVTNYRSYDYNSYKLAIQKMISQHNIQSIYISYDNDKVEPSFLELLKDFNIIKYKKPDYISELQYVTIKMLLLSKCNFFVCNRISTFSELVFWFNRCKQYVINV